MGKDNVYFHTIYFPSVLFGDGRDWTRLHHLSTTGNIYLNFLFETFKLSSVLEYLNYEGGKFSKSHNRGVFGPAAKETGIPPSVWRYYLISTRPESQDSMFSWDDCVSPNQSTESFPVPHKYQRLPQIIAFS
jgi:methionyl-tRNA synthetase